VRRAVNCPRCDRPLETYALGGRHASTCERCGWVGIDASFAGEERPETESWAAALGRVSERRVTTDRGPNPPVPTAEESGDAGPAETVVPGQPPGPDDDGAETDGDAGTDGDGTSAGESAETNGSERESDDGEPVGSIERVDAEEAERLRAAGIGTVAGLARAEPGELAEATGLAESRLREYVRRAGIRRVTGGGDGEPDPGAGAGGTATDTDDERV
jgi:hypothetical protein